MFTIFDNAICNQSANGRQFAYQENLCAFARFCDPEGRIWNLVKQDSDAA